MRDKITGPSHGRDNRGFESTTSWVSPRNFSSPSSVLVILPEVSAQKRRPSTFPSRKECNGHMSILHSQTVETPRHGQPPPQYQHHRTLSPSILAVGRPRPLRTSTPSIVHAQPNCSLFSHDATSRACLILGLHTSSEPSRFKRSESTIRAPEPWPVEPS